MKSVCFLVFISLLSAAPSWPELTPHSPVYTSSKPVSERDAKIADQYRDRALLLRSERDYASAEEYVRRALSIDPSRIDDYLLLGELFEARGMFAEAENEYSIAFLKNPTNPLCFDHLTYVYLKLEKYDEALRACDYASSVHGEPEMRWVRRGEILDRAGQASAALREYARARWELFWAPKPPRFDTFVLEADLLFREKKYSQSAAVLNTALSLSSSLSADSNAFVLPRLRALGKTVPLMKEMLLRNEFYRNDDALVAELDSKKPSERRAKDLIQKTEAAQNQSVGSSLSSNLETAMLFARARFDERFSVQGQEIADAAAAILKRDPAFIPAYLLKARAEESLGGPIKALVTLREAEARAPGQKEVLSAVAALAKNGGNDFIERVYLERLVRLHPDGRSDEARVRLAANLDRSGEYVRALQILNGVQGIDESKFPVLKLNRDFQFAFGANGVLPPEERIKYFKSLADRDQTMAAAGIALIYEKAGIWHQASREILRSLEECWSNEIEPPAYLVRTMDRVLSKAAESKTNDVWSERLRQRLTQKYGSPGSLAVVNRIRLGELPPVGSTGAKLSKTSLEEMLRYTLLSKDEMETALLPTTLEKLIDLAENEVERKRYFRIYFKNEADRVIRSGEEGDLAGMEKNFRALVAFASKKSLANELDFFQLDRRRDAFLDVAKIRTLSLKDDASARKDLDVVRLRHVGEPFFYAALARRLLDAGEVNRAYEVARDAVDYFPDDAESHFLLATAHFQNANFNRGADECRRALLLRPDHDATYALYARLLAARHRYGDSLKVVKKARENCSVTPESDLAEGDVFLASGEPLRALEIYRSLLARQPVRVALFHNAGLASLYAGKIRDAIFFFERASLFSEEAQVSRYYLAETRYRLGEYDEARNILEALLEKQPKEPYFLYALGRVYETFMLRGPASDFRRYWDLARSVYTRAMESSRFYTEPHLWAAERLKDLARDHFVKRLEPAEARVRTALLSADSRSFRILACFETGRVVNYDLTTLKPIWATSLETVPVQKPFRLGDDFLIAGETGFLTRLRESDGSVKAKYRLPAPMDNAPLYSEPFLFIPTRGGAVEILQDDKSFGALRFPGDIRTGLAFQGTTVFAGCGNGELAAGDIYSRKIRWVTKMSDAPSGDLVLSDGKLFAGSRDRQFYAVDAKTGREAFLYRNESAPTAFAAKSDDKILYGTEGGLIRMLGGKGEFYWQYQADGSVDAPLSQGGLLLFSESPAGVVGLTYGEGKEMFRVSLDSRPVAPPVFIDRDLIAVMTENGYFYHIFLSRGWKNPNQRL